MIILAILYLVIGYKSVVYCKVHIFHIVFEVSSGFADHFIGNCVSAFLLGWIAIPVMIIHWLLFGRKN